MKKTINDVKHNIYSSSKEIGVNENPASSVKDLEIPQLLRDFHLNFKIKGGIESITLQVDEKIGIPDYIHGVTVFNASDSKDDHKTVTDTIAMDQDTNDQVQHAKDAKIAEAQQSTSEVNVKRQASFTDIESNKQKIQYKANIIKNELIDSVIEPQNKSLVFYKAADNVGFISRFFSPIINTRVTRLAKFLRSINSNIDLVKFSGRQKLIKDVTNYANAIHYKRSDKFIIKGSIIKLSYSINYEDANMILNFYKKLSKHNN